MKIKDLKKNEVIHCSTLEEAKAICKLMDEADLRWCTGKSYIFNDEWNSHYTCYRPATGSQASLNYYKEEGFTVYPASKFLEEEFVLPEKWYCKPNTEEEAKILGKWFDDNGEGNCGHILNFYYNNPSNVALHGISNKGFGCGRRYGDQEITFEQFKEHVLNKTDMTTEQKIEELQKQLDELKAKHKEETDFKVGDIVVVIQKDVSEEGKTGKIKGVNPKVGEYFVLENLENFYNNKQIRKATPEEIEEYNNRNSLPKINNYEGEYIPSQGIIKYGCAKLDIDWFKDTDNRHIKSLTLSSGVEINEEQMNQIRKYLDNATV